MIISLIAAMDEGRGIGWKGRVPWRLPSDLKRFRALTMGHHIVVGRKTYESIGRPLPGRQTIIVTRKRDLSANGCLVAGSVEEAVELARSRAEKELFICGGAEIYAQALPMAKRFYLTLVHARVESDTFFPEWDEAAWVETESTFQDADEKDEYASTFKLLERSVIPSEIG